MVSTYTGTGRLTKQGTNDNPNTWGSILNAQVIELMDEFVAGVIDVDITGSSNVVLTTNNGSSDQARHATIELTGALGADIDLEIPALEKQYFVRGDWTGSNTVTVKINGSSTGVLMRTGDKKIVYCNGTDTYDMVDTGLFVSGNDTTSANLDDKLLVSEPLEKNIDNPSSNETLTLSMSTEATLSSMGLSGQAFTPGGATTTDITFPVGAFAAEDGTYMEFTSAVTKEIDSVWAPRS